MPPVSLNFIFNHNWNSSKIIFSFKFMKYESRHRWCERQQNVIIWAQTEMTWHTVYWHCHIWTESYSSITILTVHQKHILSYSVVCLTTGPKPLPKRFLHIVRSKASSFKWEYPLLSLRLSSSFLRLLPRLLVTS